MFKPFLMPAHQWVSASSSTIDGEHGDSDLAGRAKGETSLGQKQLGWSSLYNLLSKELDPDLASRFLEITEVSWKGGGPAAAVTTKSMEFLNKSTPFSTLIVAKSLPDTSSAPPTLLTNQEAYFHTIAESSLLSKFPPNSSHSSSITTTHLMESIGSSTILKIAQGITTADPSTLHQEVVTASLLTWTPKPGKSLRQEMAGKTLRIQSNNQIPPGSLTPTPSLPHSPNLALNVLVLHPHCHMGDRVRLWKLEMARASQNVQGNPTPLSQEDIELIEGVSLNALQPSTWASYGAGLLAFHIFCDLKKVDENLRAPVDLTILQLFIARMAGIYSTSTISGYVAAICA